MFAGARGQAMLVRRSGAQYVRGRKRHAEGEEAMPICMWSEERGGRSRKPAIPLAATRMTIVKH